MAATPKSAAKTRAEQEAAEYSTWVAVRPIPFGNTFAFMPGMAVPVSHVEEYGYDEQGLVERVSGEAKTQAEQSAATGTPPDAPQ